MKKLAVTVALLLVPTCVGAIEVRERVDFRGDYLKAAVIVLENGVLREVEGKVVTAGGVSIVSAEAGIVSNDALVAGMVLLTDGRVITSPLRRRDSAPASWSKEELKTEAVTLEKSRDRTAAEVKELEGELYLATLHSRQAAGLQSVDNLREEADWLKEEITRLQTSLNNLPSNSN